MINFIHWLYDGFFDLISTITSQTLRIIIEIFDPSTMGTDGLYDTNINLVLFSDTPILTMSIYDLLLLFFSVFYTVIFVVIVWKIIKKVVVKITRWDKW